MPRESLPALRDSLLSLLSLYGSGPRPIRTQLCVALASLALQMPEWKNVLQLVGAALGSDPKNGTAILEFLKVLPEEVTEGRKVTLTVRTATLGLASTDKIHMATAGREHDLMESN